MTPYGLDGLGIKSWSGGKIFCTHSDLPCGLPIHFYNGYWVSFPGVKWPEHGDHPPPSSAEVKEKVELYLYSKVFVDSSRVNFTFTTAMCYWCK
jgi:hypothetical protein